MRNTVQQLILSFFNVVCRRRTNASLPATVISPFLTFRDDDANDDAADDDKDGSRFVWYPLSLLL